MADQIRAVVQQGGDKPKLEIGLVPKPQPAANQSLIKVLYAAQNPTDSM
jgi:NADPH:quinone reductase-like Zn-dependent oxidoreductase